MWNLERCLRSPRMEYPPTWRIPGAFAPVRYQDLYLADGVISSNTKSDGPHPEELA